MLEVVQRAAARAARPAHQAHPLLTAHSARPEAWSPAQWPGLAELDRVTAGVLFVAWCFDSHSLIANSAALAHAGIGDHTPDPAGGHIGRDARGHLTGVMYEHAALAVWNALPEPTADERARHLLAAIASLEAQFDEVHDLKADARLGPALAQLDRSDRLTARYSLWPLVEHVPDVHGTRAAWTSDRVHLAGGKVFVDGTLNSRTAWMLHPYADGMPGHPRGTPMMTPDQLEHAVRTCDSLGLPMAAHAIGDAAVRAVLDAIERVRPRTPGFRIEHAELIDEADIPRFAQLGVIASVQPCHLLYDIEALRRGLPQRLDRVLPLRELARAGCRPGELMMFGSDVPIVRANPADSLQAAIHRRRATMPPGEAIGQEQALTLAESLTAFGQR